MILFCPLDFGSVLDKSLSTGERTIGREFIKAHGFMGNLDCLRRHYKTNRRISKCGCCTGELTDYFNHGPRVRGVCWLVLLALADTSYVMTIMKDKTAKVRWDTLW